jgi:hypothetical protein
MRNVSITLINRGVVRRLSIALRLTFSKYDGSCPFFFAAYGFAPRFSLGWNLSPYPVSIKGDFQQVAVFDMSLDGN